MDVAERELVTATTPPAKPDIAPDDRQLRTMFAITRIMASEHDLEAMIPALLASLIQGMPPADAGLLMLHNPVTDVLEVKAAATTWRRCRRCAWPPANQ